MNESMSNQEIKKLYFIEYWKTFTQIRDGETSQSSQFDNLEQDSINPILYNPKELFKEFIDEIERKNLSNVDNKKFFTNNVNDLVNLKLEGLKFLESILTIIQQQFDKNDFSYLLYVLKFALNKMDNFRLGKECVKELETIISNKYSLDENKNRETIKHLVHFIVFELEEKEFSEESIQKIIQNDNPISALNECFDRQPVEVKFIFECIGLKYNTSLQIGEIEIYNPLFKQLMAKDEHVQNRKLEFFKNRDIKDSEDRKLDSILKSISEQSTFEENDFCNIAINVDLIDVKYSENEAIRKARSFFDNLTARHLKINHKLTIGSKYVIVDREGKHYGFRKKFNNLEIDLHNYLDLKSRVHLTKYQDYYAKLISKKSLSIIDNKISESLSWKRKALETYSKNDSILLHWICLENLFETQNKKVLENIMNVASKILASYYIYEFANKIHVDLLNDISCKIPIFLLDNNKYAELLNKMKQLKEVKSNAIFLKAMWNIMDIMDKDELFNKSFLLENIKKMHKIFSDKQECQKFIKMHQNNFKQKLIFLYRIRNKIVHNANTKENSITSYYSHFANYVNAVIMGYFIEQRTQGLKTNEEIIHDGEYEYNKMLLNLEKHDVDSIINPEKYE
ncbi:MAG: hypothetical protein HDT12_02475 [Helicobacter sp.]|nr:hypothetical protein [Helicobacter sp.]